MKHRIPLRGLVACGLSLSALPAMAQTPPPVQKVTGPSARYWVSAEMSSGLSMATNHCGVLR